MKRGGDAQTSGAGEFLNLPRPPSEPKERKAAILYIRCWRRLVAADANNGRRTMRIRAGLAAALIAPDTEAATLIAPDTGAAALAIAMLFYNHAARLSVHP